jgi:hypothetical protein
MRASNEFTIQNLVIFFSTSVLLLMTAMSIPDPGGFFRSPWYVENSPDVEPLASFSDGTTVAVRYGYPSDFDAQNIYFPALISTPLNIFELESKYSSKFNFTASVKHEGEANVQIKAEIVPQYGAQSNTLTLRSLIPAFIKIPLGSISPGSNEITNFENSAKFSVYLGTNYLFRKIITNWREFLPIVSNFSIISLSILLMLNFHASFFCDKRLVLTRIAIFAFVFAASYFGTVQTLALEILLWGILCIAILPLAVLRPAGRWMLKICTVVAGDNVRRSLAERTRIFWILLAGVLVISFFFNITAWDSFKWGQFEERDFLIAKEMSEGSLYPHIALGPQLLMGGQTPGGFLYFILQFMAGGNSGPEVFAFFTRVAHVGALILLIMIVVKYFGWIEAVATGFVFATSEIVIANASWPIHPSMSVVVYFLFILFSLNFYVNNKISSGIFSFFFLSILIQFHFSYVALLVPAILLTAQIINQPGSKKYLFWMVCAFSGPLVPYFIYEFSHGFENLAIIMEKPRFNSAYVPQNIGLSKPIVSVFYKWFSLSSPFESVANAYSILAKVFLGIGLLSAIVSVLAPGIENDKNRKAAGAILLFICAPFLLILISGLGYYPRHTLSFALPAFFLIAIGINKLISFRKLLLPSVSILVIAGMATHVFATTANSNYFSGVSKGYSEWDVPYDKRQLIARKLASDLRVTPEQYARQVWFWWTAWATSPVFYEEIYESQNLVDNSATSLQSNETIFVFCGGAPSGPLLRYFSWTKLFSEDCFNVYLGTPLLSNNPVSNTVNKSFLSEDQHFLETARLEEGASVVRKGADYEHVVVLPGDKIRISLQFESANNGDLIRWRLNSPHLSGYYQELKRLWRPRLVFRNSSEGSVRELELSEMPIGGLLKTTPMEGTIHLPGNIKEWHVSFAISGYIDQSSMKRPRVEEMQWDLGKVAQQN